MLKKILLITILLSIVCSFALNVEARPPSQIELAYDREKQSLHVVVKHISDNMRKHYIRKIDVSRNDEDPVPYYFSSQTSAAELIIDIPLEAQPNDVIYVEAVCSEAGRAEQTLVITEE